LSVGSNLGKGRVLAQKLSVENKPTMTEDNLPGKLVLLLASDLMLSSNVSGFAAAAGMPFRTALTVDEVAGILAASSGCLLLVDLGLAGLDVADLASRIPASVLSNAVAYGPHVHEEKLAAAAAAGVSEVMSRGQFSASVGRLIGQYAA